jgi:hypothetical protein
MFEFNVSGGECLSLGHFLWAWPPDMRSKNYLIRFPRKVRPLYV